MGNNYPVLAVVLVSRSDHGNLDAYHVRFRLDAAGGDCDFCQKDTTTVRSWDMQEQHNPAECPVFVKKLLLRSKSCGYLSE